MEAEFGNAQHARLDANAALDMARGGDARIVVLLALARAGDEKRAHALANDLAARFPADTLINGVWLPAARAQFQLSRHNPTRAIEILQSAAPYELGWYIPPLPNLYAVYLRGEPYLAVRKGPEAVAEFQKILDHRGIAGDSPLYSLARLGLARAYATQGDIAKAKAVYRDFLILWKDADRDIPVLNEAKSESARLQ